MTASPRPAGKLARYGAFNTWDAVKLLALASMLIDHIGYFFFPDALWMRAVGRAAFPMFLLLTGFAATFTLRHDLVAAMLALWAINFYVGGTPVPVNILFTILIARLLLQQIERGRLNFRKPAEWFVLLVSLLLLTTLIFEYGTLGLIFALSGYMQRRNEAFSARVRLLYLGGGMLIHGLVQYTGLSMPPLTALLMAAALAGTAWLLWNLRIRPVALPRTLKRIEPLLRFAARQMLWIYTVHAGLFMLATGTPMARLSP